MLLRGRAEDFSGMVAAAEDFPCCTWCLHGCWGRLPWLCRQGRLCLGAGSVSQQKSLLRDFLILPSPWREVGGSTAPCSLRGVADAGASPTCFLFPPGKPHGSWSLHPINHRPLRISSKHISSGACACGAHQGARMAPCSPRAF